MVDVNNRMRGPVIPQQQAGGQISTLKHTPKESSNSITLETKFEGKFNTAKWIITCPQKSSMTIDDRTICYPTCSAPDITKNATHLTYEQAKVYVQARKRKERQESVTSICQDKKLIRSNSEERPINNTNNIRRVSSHEDFNKNKNKEDPQSLQAHLHKKDNFTELECQYEKQRSNERFSKPLVQRVAYISQSQRPRSKHFGKKEKHKHANRSETQYLEAIGNYSEENEIPSQFLQLHQMEPNRSPSPTCLTISPALDLTTLHQQIDYTEPLPSTVTRQISEDNEILTSLSMTSNTLLSSPRNSVIGTQRIYLNPNISQTKADINNDSKNSLEYCQKLVVKHIHRVKKKRKKHDEDFLTSYEHIPSHADKQINKCVKKSSEEFHKLKREHATLLEGTSYFHKLGELERTRPILRNTLQDIEKKLDSKRLLAGRSKIIHEMTNEHLIEEKTAVQKALLYLESQHGRPSLKEDKDLARPLYDRYRLLKRLVAKLNMTNNIIELATIHEHETMDFATMLPITFNMNLTIACDHIPTNQQELLTSSTIPANSTTDNSDTDTSIGENLHALTLEELYEQQNNTTEEKKQLRRTLREFEFDFKEKRGRRVQREDKMIMEDVYQSYKNIKAKLKLLDALVGKQSL